MKSIGIPEEQAFLNAAPTPPSIGEIEKRTTFGQKDTLSALENQFELHKVLQNPMLDIPTEVSAQMEYFRSLAFAGLNPSRREIERLFDTAVLADFEDKEVIKKLCAHMWMNIRKNSFHWEKTEYEGEQRIRAQDSEAIDELAYRLAGEERILVFGSARLKEDHPDYDGTRWLMKTLVSGLPHEDGTTEQVITGGGPGIMEAANRGAMEGAYEQLKNLHRTLTEGKEDPEEVIEKIVAFRQQIHSIGVGIELSHEKSWNKWIQMYITSKGFAPRKTGLVSTAVGRSIKHPKKDQNTSNGKRKPAIFAVTGGFGTLDELFEVLTLMQCQKMPHIPVIVMGEKLGKALEVMVEALLESGTINPKDTKLFTIANNEVEALEQYLEYYNQTAPAKISSAIDERKKMLGSDVKQLHINFKRATSGPSKSNSEVQTG